MIKKYKFITLDYKSITDHWTGILLVVSAWTIDTRVEINERVMERSSSMDEFRLYNFHKKKKQVQVFLC
jgi:hypothetical protein